MNTLVDPNDYPDALTWLEAELAMADVQAGRTKTKMASTTKAVPVAQAQQHIMLQLDYARRAQHLTMSQLAKKIGMKQSNLSRAWSRKGNPSIGTLLKIAAALGVEIVISGGDLVQ